MNEIFQAFRKGEKSYPHWSEDPDAWIGKGYYFWDSTINLAHWWGQIRFNGKYNICKSTFDCNGGDFFDLVGNSVHRGIFIAVKNALQARVKTLGEKVRVVDVINYLKKDPDFKFSSKFKAIRVYPQKSRMDFEQTAFAEKLDAFYEDDPPIQLCVTDYSFFKSTPEIVY